MTTKQVEDRLTELVHRQPFVPFVVELANGETLTVARPPAFDETGAVLIGPDGGFIEFEFKKVRAICLLCSGITRMENMTIQQIEAKMIELKHQEPFVPFAVEMADGQLIEIPDAHLAINETGAGYIGEDFTIVDIDFKNVRAIRPLGSEAVA